MKALHHLIIAFVAVFIFVATGCEGYYRASGTVLEITDGNKKPLSSVTVKVFSGPNLLRGTIVTDSLGQYKISGLTSPSKIIFYVTYEKTNYKTDTIKVKGNRGKTYISHNQIMTKTKP